jgi:hypothetical protein
MSRENLFWSIIIFSCKGHKSNIFSLNLVCEHGVSQSKPRVFFGFLNIFMKSDLWSSLHHMRQQQEPQLRPRSRRHGREDRRRAGQTGTTAGTAAPRAN